MTMMTLPKPDKLPAEAFEAGLRLMDGKLITRATEVTPGDRVTVTVRSPWVICAEASLPLGGIWRSVS